MIAGAVQHHTKVEPFMNYRFVYVFADIGQLAALKGNKDFRKTI